MRKAMLILLLILAPNLFSQNQDEQQYEIVSHRVMMGETVRMLSKKYLVPPAEIYRLNKFAVDGISQGMVLQIPVPVKDKPIVEEPVAQTEQPAAETPAPDVNSLSGSSHSNSTTEHRVQSGETLSGLAQQYGVTVSAIKAANPKVAKRGLRADELILIPSVAVADDYVNEVNSALPGKTSEPQTAPTQAYAGLNPGEHRVSDGETLSGLSQQYGVAINAIKEANPKVAKRGLRSGEIIKIPSVENASVTEPAIVEKTATEDAAPSETIEHTVKPGETLFGLAKKYNVSPEVIKSQNSRILARGLQVGQVIKIRPE